MHNKLYIICDIFLTLSDRFVFYVKLHTLLDAFYKVILIFSSIKISKHVFRFSLNHISYLFNLEVSFELVVGYVFIEVQFLFEDVLVLVPDDTSETGQPLQQILEKLVKRIFESRREVSFSATDEICCQNGLQKQLHDGHV